MRHSVSGGDSAAISSSLAASKPSSVGLATDQSAAGKTAVATSLRAAISSSNPALPPLHAVVRSSALTPTLETRATQRLSMRYALPQQLMRAGLPKGGSYQTAELQPR